MLRIDDILVTGENDQEHLSNVEAVLRVMKSNGLNLKGQKCTLLADEVIYLGYRVNKVEKKVRPILKTPESRDTTQLRSFLGMLQ